MNNINQLLQETQRLKEQQKKLNQEMRAKKATIAKEYMDGLSEPDKAAQIKDAERILSDVKIAKDKLKAEFSKGMAALKDKVTLAKAHLEFVNYQGTHSLPKVKNQYSIEKNTLTIKRDGLKDISLAINTGWEKILKAELKKQGINGNDRVADNIVYKAQLAVKTHMAA